MITLWQEDVPFRPGIEGLFVDLVELVLRAISVRAVAVHGCKVQYALDAFLKLRFSPYVFSWRSEVRGCRGAVGGAVTWMFFGGFEKARASVSVS